MMTLDKTALPRRKPTEPVRDAGQRDAQHPALWIAMYQDRVAGRDRSLPRLMRRVKRDGIAPQHCAFRLAAARH